MVVPSEVRRKLGLKEGVRLHMDVNEQTRKIILTPVTREYIRGQCGKYKGKGLLKALAVEKRRSKNI
jgi:AbrB family looped-hinge helix DNA binding protein